MKDGLLPHQKRRIENIAYEYMRNDHTATVKTVMEHMKWCFSHDPYWLHKKEIKTIVKNQFIQS